MLARKINQAIGGAVVTPWTIDELPDEYIDAFEALDGLPHMRRQRQAVEDAFAKFRAGHPTYRK